MSRHRHRSRHRARGRSRARGRLGAVLLVAALAVLALPGAAAGAGAGSPADAGRSVAAGGVLVAPAAANGENVTVTTTGSGLVVEVTDPVSDRRPTVTVTGEAGGNRTAALGDNGTELRMNFSTFEGMALRNASVAVRADGESLHEATVDLRLLRLRTAASPGYDGSSLLLPADAGGSVGFVDGDVARVRLTAVETDDEATVAATYRDDGDGASLVVEYDEYEPLLNATGPVAVETVDGRSGPTVAGSGPVVGDVVAAAAAATDVARTPDGLRVRSPLVRSGTEYGVTVDVGYGTWSDTVTAADDGRLAVPSGAAASAGTVTLTVEGRAGLLDGREFEVNRSANEAVVDGDGTTTTVTIEGRDGDASITGGVEGMWVRGPAGGAVGWLPLNGTQVTPGANRVTLDEAALDDLSRSGVVVNETGPYAFVVVTDGGVVRARNASVQGGLAGAGSQPGGNDTNGSAGGRLPLPLVGSGGGVPFGVVGVGLGGVALVAAGALAFVAVRRRRGGGSSGGRTTGSGATGATGATGAGGTGSTGAGATGATGAGGTGSTGAGGDGTTALSVRVTDAEGRPVDERLRCEVRPRRGNDAARVEEFEGGRVELRVPARRCAVAVGHDGTEVASRSVDPRGTDAVTVRLEPYRVTVTARDEETGEAVDDARLVAELADGSERSARADGRGRARVRVPKLAGEVTFRVEADGYVTKRRSTVLTRNMDEEVPLARDRSDLTVTPRVDGAALPRAEVTVEPVDGGGSSARARTDESGRASFDALAAGRYRIGVRPSGDGFGTAEETVTVGGDSDATVVVEVPFEFELDAAHRRRLRELDGRLDDLTAASDRDVAVPHYFASAARRLRAEAERLPARGDVVARTGLEPSGLAAALVDAAERTVGVVEDAMNAKRSVDLFGVSAELPPAEVTWDGEYDVDALVRTVADPDVGRRLTRERLAEVDERVTTADAELADVTPVRELVEGIRTGYDLSEEDRATVAARTVAALGLLDAVERLFEHERLRERLDTTIF